MAKDPYNKGQVDEAAIAEEQPQTISNTPTTGQTQQVTTPEAGQGGQASATQTTGQEQQPASTPSVDPNGNTFTESQMIERFGSNPATGNTETTQSTGQGEVVTTPSTHPFDWANKSFSTVISENPDKPLQDILSDHYKWARENGQMVDIIGINEAVRGKDISKSPAQNESDEKKRLNKEKFDQLGNFLLHVGNAIGNMAGGGMGAVKLEDPIKFTDRQRMLKERAEELRNRYNDSVLAQMTKQDAEQRRADLDKRRQDRLDKETQIRQEKNDAYRRYQESVASKNEAMAAYYEAKVNALEQGLPLEEALKRAKIAKEEAQARLNNVKANAGGFAPKSTPNPVQQKETTTVTKDRNGRVRGSRTTRTGAYGTTTQQTTSKGRIKVNY